MTDAARKPGFHPLLGLLGLLVIAGLAGLVYLECKTTELTVDSVPVAAGDFTVTFATARSRILRRPVSRLILIESEQARSFHRLEWRLFPSEWHSTECVLMSDREGIRIGSQALFRHLWAGPPFFLGPGHLRRAAAETGDPDLTLFLRRHKLIP